MFNRSHFCPGKSVKTPHSKQSNTPNDLQGVWQKQKAVPSGYTLRVSDEEMWNAPSLGQTLLHPYKALQASFSRHTLSVGRETMTAADIDTSFFKPHSIRAATASKANQMNIPIQTILDAADWKNAKTFAKHYDLPISFSESFGTKLLDSLLQWLLVLSNYTYYNNNNAKKL